MPQETNHRSAVEARFAEVFAHLGLLSAHARRRGARDPDAIAAEAMAIAWRRLADVPRDDPRPWLIATARNLVLAERRRRHGAALHDLEGVEPAAEPDPPMLDLDPELEAALTALSRDRPRGLASGRLGGPHTERRGSQPGDHRPERPRLVAAIR
ncbi:MAG: hypothetical protein ACTHMY_04735 [Solirubrobacteraceae bacterium]